MALFIEGYYKAYHCGKVREVQNVYMGAGAGGMAAPFVACERPLLEL
jgi:hypothetical protein